MKFEDYSDYTELLARSKELKKQLISIDSQYQGQGDKIVDIGWLQLTFGNGSNRQTVLNNSNHMKEVAKLMKSLVSKELEEVLQKMDEL